MLRITGYSDKYAAFPGEKINFHINSENNENYDFGLLRHLLGLVFYRFCRYCKIFSVGTHSHSGYIFKSIAV